MTLHRLEAKFETRALGDPDEPCDSANTTSAYGERLLQPDEIRLLSIHRGTDGLRLSVARHKFQDDLEYDAVSYVWGTAVASIKVPCNGIDLTVTPTVFEMLQYLDPNRSYWLDSVCINQQDLEEKAVQIPLMHRIYSLAAFVVIWMGLPTTQIEKFMLGLPSALKNMREWNSMVDQDIEPGIQEPDLVVKDEDFWFGMVQVCTHKWFERLWTFQEAVLAKQPIMLFGLLWLSFEEFLEFTDRGYNKKPAYIIGNFGVSFRRFFTMGICRESLLPNGAVLLSDMP